MGNHVSFSLDWQFRQNFGRRFVREGVLMKPLKQLAAMLTDAGHGSSKDSAASPRILILSRVAIDFSQQLSHSLVSGRESCSQPSDKNLHILCSYLWWKSSLISPLGI